VHSLKKAIRQSNPEKESSKPVVNQLLIASKPAGTGPKLAEPFPNRLLWVIPTPCYYRRCLTPGEAAQTRSSRRRFDLETTGSGRLISPSFSSSKQARIVEDDDEDESNKAFLTLSLNHLRRAVAHLPTSTFYKISRLLCPPLSLSSRPPERRVCGCSLRLRKNSQQIT
jgi:hypothetical protein